MYFELGVHKLNSQLAAADALDAKAGMMLAAALTEIALLAAVLTLRPTVGYKWLFLACGIVGLFAAGACFLALRVREWNTFPHPSVAWDNFDDQIDSHAQMGTTLSTAVEAVVPGLKAKAMWVLVAQLLVVLETGAFAGAAALVAGVF